MMGSHSEDNVPSVVYDGPTVNGKPLLTVEVVEQWFKEAYGCIPSPEEATSLAKDINHCAFLSVHWKPEFNKQRRGSADVLRMERIGLALTALKKDIPVLIANNIAVRPGPPDERLVVLLSSVSSLEPLFQLYRPRRGRQPELWHNVARNLGRKIIETAKADGVKRPGLGAPTSPAIGILKNALGFLGLETTVEAICDAVRPTRNRQGK